MITSKDIFHIVLNDHERESIYKELNALLPQLTNETAKKFVRLYELRSELRQSED